MKSKMRVSKINLCAIGIILTFGICIGTKANGKIAQFSLSNNSTQNIAQIPPPPPSASPAPFPSPAMEKEGPPITSESSPDQIALAAHLQRINAKMYGAYWCPHCHSQQELFGKEAFTALNYIECDSRGKDARPDLCKAANIKAYPSWEIRGKYYTGRQSLEKLAILSGYKGSRNFQLQVPSP
ncbi:hypothetical protein QT971_03540 [Microcoleus sp. herbarium19]|uniref:hypothetical protein n=1 Tax=unclassified Microcoleus TaxID=2642155 RepID=UPI002FD31CF2